LESMVKEVFINKGKRDTFWKI
jgi:hypothetical protein